MLNLKEPITKVFDYLYLGDAEDSQNFPLLRECEISHIINVTYSLPNEFPNEFNYLRVPARDVIVQDMRQYFKRTNQYIEDARANGDTVFVHCRAGSSRSATIVLAYCLSIGMKFQEALDFLTSKRVVCSPNFGFLGQSYGYYKDLCKSVFK